MILVLIVFLGGVLTILSPCILPVLPFVFTRADRKFSTNGLPMLIGMALTFTGIATLAAVGGAWVVRLNQVGRAVALVLLAAFAATLLSRRLADWLARPFVALGNKLAASPHAAASGRDGILTSFLLGVATGLLWAPCAGPILGLLLTGAALSGPTARTTLLLLAYAAGAAASLAVAVLAGGRVFAILKRSLGAGEWVRRTLGVAVLLAVAGIAFGWDGTVLTRLSQNGTDRLEASLLRYGPAQDAARAAPGGSGASAASVSTSNGAASDLSEEGELPALSGATGWLNSMPLTRAALRGKVVLVDFWTYSCINCLRSLPYVKRWYDAYKDHGLVVIGVHAPEFPFERDPDNVRRAVHELGIAYPVAIDDDYAIWRGFGNQYWPAHYFIDATGHIRAHHFGEGDYDGSERVIRELLAQAGYTDLPKPAGAPAAAGIEAPPDLAHVDSPETYIGYARADGFRSPGGFADDREKSYALPPSLALNQWALLGRWTDGPERAVLESGAGRIEFRFLARDLHLVLGPGAGKAVRFRVRLDGAAPGADHGVDTDAEGNGVIREQRLYQLIRQTGRVAEHTFSIEFLDGGVEAYSFTFG
ncbi:MAG TPA: cytochrome c biogenesis protein CcdA [Steroidobacteraceae bacterium]|nr:cytochrome c biogenesis protein CcdA [Steroidobacteraceae bacterium]